MEKVRRKHGIKRLMGLLGGLIVMVGSMATEAESFFGSKSTEHLLTFTYICDVGENDEEMDNYNTTVKILGNPNDDSPFCLKHVPNATLNLTFCQTRRDAMRDVIEDTHADCLVTTDDGGGTDAQTDAAALQVVCSDSERDVLKVTKAVCAQIHTLTSAP